MEGKWTGPRDDESVVVVERNNKLLSLPVRQEINEALDVEKRKDMIVVRGIKEDEDVEEKVGMIMEELGFKERIHRGRQDWWDEKEGSWGVGYREWRKVG